MSRAERTRDSREGALDRFANPDTKDLGAKLEILQHELYATQQRVLENQFILEYGDTIRMKTVRVPSSDELVPLHVFTPRNMPAGRRHPVLMMVHGGYHERLDTTWFPLIAKAVEKGWIVAFPEYRGSRGFGEAIYKNDYGVTDIADVLAASEYMAGRDYAEPQRMAILGQSRGGMLTLLAIQKSPQRFRAAIDIVGLTDMVAYMAYKPEYRRQQIARENPSFRDQLPDSNLPAYMDVSPINNVDAIRTPLLVLATTGDKIAPVSLHTGRLVDALKARGKIFEAKIYENAPGGHVFMSADTPERADAMTRIFAWLDRHAPAP